MFYLTVYMSPAKRESHRWWEQVEVKLSGGEIRSHRALYIISGMLNIYIISGMKNFHVNVWSHLTEAGTFPTTTASLEQIYSSYDNII